MRDAFLHRTRTGAEVAAIPLISPFIGAVAIIVTTSPASNGVARVGARWPVRCYDSWIAPLVGMSGRNCSETSSTTHASTPARRSATSGLEPLRARRRAHRQTVARCRCPLLTRRALRRHRGDQPQAVRDGESEPAPLTNLTVALSILRCRRPPRSRPHPIAVAGKPGTTRVDRVTKAPLLVYAVSGGGRPPSRSLDAPASRGPVGSQNRSPSVSA